MSLSSASWILVTASWICRTVTSSLRSNYAAFCTPRLPPELLDRVIDDLYDDRRSLLSLSLVCKQTLAKSRAYLFSTIFIDNKNSQFDAFLLLLNRPWTSFTPAVETLHLKDLFHPQRRYKYHEYSSIERLIAHLPNVRAVWLTSLTGAYIPDQIRELLFSLPVLDYQLDRVDFYDSEEAIEFFSMFPLTYSGSISLYDIQYRLIPEFPTKLGVFRQPLLLKTLDTSSLVFLKNVLTPLATECDPELSVDSFHLRLPSLWRSDIEQHIIFISEFLLHVGPSLNRLFIELLLPDVIPGPAVNDFYDSLNFSQCTSLRVVHIGHIKMTHVDNSSDIESQSFQTTMWRILSAFPAERMEEIVISFAPYGDSPQERELQLRDFAWIYFVSRLRGTLTHLNKITIRLGGVYFVHPSPEFATCVDAMRKGGLKQFEEEGIVLFDVVTVSSSGELVFEPPWRQATDSW